MQASNPSPISQPIPTKRNGLAHFQRWSSRYERSWLQERFFRPAQQAVLEIMARYLTVDPATVLDVGSGTGRLLRAVHERWPDASLKGIDPTPGMVESARQLTPDAIFEVGFAEALPLSDASIDAVTSTISFHHWSDQGAGLQEIVRVLRPEGYFFLADILLPAWIARFLPRSYFKRPAQIRALFEQAGLQILHQQSVVSGHVLITVGKPEVQ